MSQVLELVRHLVCGPSPLPAAHNVKKYNTSSILIGFFAPCANPAAFLSNDTVFHSFPARVINEDHYGEKHIVI